MSDFGQSALGIRQGSRYDRMDDRLAAGRTKVRSAYTVAYNK